MTNNKIDDLIDCLRDPNRRLEPDLLDAADALEILRLVPDAADLLKKIAKVRTLGPEANRLRNAYYDSYGESGQQTRDKWPWDIQPIPEDTHPRSEAYFNALKMWLKFAVEAEELAWNIGTVPKGGSCDWVWAYIEPEADDD